MFENISCYKFIELSNLESLKLELLEFGNDLKIKGTILVSVEGINIFVAGDPENICKFKDYIYEKFNFINDEVKSSFSANIPFRSFYVKIKKEIISFSDESSNPLKTTAPYISAKQLAEDLSNNSDTIMLDTRNDYELRIGKFKNTVDLNLKTFKDFKEKIKSIEHLKDKKIVTYCTGGIRCEKAALYLKENGFSNVSQLEGGILKYFEVIGNKHYQGDCFVFDHRVAVDANLKQTDMKLCYACREPLTVEECNSDKYCEAKHCPYCYDSKTKNIDNNHAICE